MLKKYFIKSFLYLAICGAVFSAFFQFAIANKVAREIVLINFVLIWTYYAFLNARIPRIRNKNSILILPILLLSFFYEKIEKESVLLYFILGVLALNYTKNTFWAGFRSIRYLKAFFIALVWACLVVLPLGTEKAILEWQILAFLWSIVYCVVLVVALLFDIKDQRTDFGNIQTLPTQLGLAKTQWISIAFLLLASAFLLFGFLQLFFSNQFFYSILVCLMYLMVMIFLSKPEKPVFFYSFWVEGTLLVPFLVYWLTILIEGLINYHSIGYETYSF